MTDAEMIHCPENDRQVNRLRAIMHRLRAPGGCPWDAEQTHESIIPNLIEEAYETIDAIQRKQGNFDDMNDEMRAAMMRAHSRQIARHPYVPKSRVQLPAFMGAA